MTQTDRSVLADCQPYRGYLIRWSIISVLKDSDRVWAELNGVHACWANTVEQAKEQIDAFYADPVQVCSWCPDAKEKRSDCQPRLLSLLRRQVGHVMRVCKARRHVDEAAAKKALWAMAQNRRDTSQLTVKPCKVCKGWHIARK